jgi:hypothetical protein
MDPLTPSTVFGSRDDALFRQMRRALQAQLVPRTLAAADTARLTDYFLECDTTAAGFTVTLPSVLSAKGQLLVPIKTDATTNTLTVAAAGSETINGASSVAVSTRFGGFPLYCDGSAWYAVAMATWGSTTPVTFTSTTSPQVRIAYDGTHSATLGVSSTGLLTINATSTITITPATTFNGGATIANGQTLTLTGVTITGLTAASVATGTFPGVYTITGAVTLSAALTYGGVTLTNSATGTGSMVLSASPTLTGTLNAAAAIFSGTVSSAGYNASGPGTFSAGANATGTILDFSDTFGGVGTDTMSHYIRNGSTVGTITTTLAATAFNTSSDARLKIDLGLATDCSVLRDLKIHKFKWIPERGGERARGVFAQEAYEIAPWAVAVGSDELDAAGRLTKPWAVEYQRFVPDLIVGWQKHESRIAALELRLNA